MSQSPERISTQAHRKARDHMVNVHIARRGMRDPHVLAAMRAVPREHFVGEAMAEFAHEDSPLPIGEGQTISQPYIVAAMIEAAEVRPGDHVLEVGAGSGYAAAVLGQIAGKVIAIERQKWSPVAGVADLHTSYPWPGCWPATT
jgi:protein-L-isoaspartate(D-aspartate) O-methyltransferase